MLSSIWSLPRSYGHNIYDLHVAAYVGDGQARWDEVPLVSARQRHIAALPEQQ